VRAGKGVYTVIVVSSVWRIWFYKSEKAPASLSDPSAGPTRNEPAGVVRGTLR